MEPPYYFLTKDGKSKILWQVQDYHNKDGAIKKEDIEAAKNGSQLKTAYKRDALIFAPDRIELIEGFKRGPQSVLLKDAMYIIGRLGITKESIVLDAGTGSGSMAAYLSLYAKKVISFEIKEEFLTIAKKNLEKINADNIEIINDSVENIKKHSSEKFDAVFLDVTRPWEMLDLIYDSLKEGAYACFYLPNMTQATEIANALGEKFHQMETVEMIKRDWNIGGRVAKPEKDLLHTAFLMFARKLQS